MVSVRWLGHSCFRVSADAESVVIDPHDGASMGLPAPPTDAGLVLLTHLHEDHASGRSLYEARGIRVLFAPAEHPLTLIKVRGVAASHDDAGGSRLGPNTVWMVEAGGVSVVHLGDVGHRLSEGQLAALGRVDVLIAGVGGGPRLAEENWRLTDARILVPMHYQTPGLVFPYFRLMGVEAFTRGKRTVLHGGDTLTLEKSDLPAEPEVHVLQPPKLDNR